MWLLCCEMFRNKLNEPSEQIELVTDSDVLKIAARRQEIIKMTEQLIESINTGDYEAYT